LQIELGDLHEEARIQNQRHGEARRDCPGIDEPIKKLESNFDLSETESQRPVIEVARLLRNERNGK
jgi:hypothetical protein